MASTNQCIGSYYDELKQRVFYFNYNSAGYNGIYVYDVNANTITPLLISFVDSAEDLFSFDPKYPVASVNILYRTEEDGDILHWTDRLNRPMKLNIKEATVSGKTYGSAWKKEYLTVARKMPTFAPVCNYGDDANVNSNNLKSKLFQFSYRWAYKDGTKSCWSPWSKLFAPYNVDTLSVESDVTKNNVISVVLQTGNVDCSNIEISVRESISPTFSDRMLVTVLDKAKKGISNNSLYTFNFYNDAVYPFLDIEESTQLFDYVPKKANAQEIADNNILVYGGITEGNTYSGSLGITSAVSVATASNLMTIQSQVSGRNWMIKFSGTPTAGDVTSILITLTKENTNTGDITTEYYSFDYTTAAGNTLTTIRDAFRTNIDADSALTAVNTSTDIGFIISGQSESGFIKTVTATYQIQYPIGSAPVDVNISCYKHASTYKFGIVYFDEFGVTNGVITTDAMTINTPKLTSSRIGLDQISVPNIQFNINSVPPSWAKSFSFVRTTNLTAYDFKMIRSNASTGQLGVYKLGDYGYINIQEYNANKSGYPAYSFAQGDRIKIYAVIGQATDSRYDLPIVGVSTVHPDPFNGPSLPAGYWLKMPYNSDLMSNWDTLSDSTRYMVEPYSPSYSSKDSDLLYYEFGENYSIITDANGNLAHGGQTQAQIINTGSQPTSARPAIFNFTKGDVYNRKRDADYIIDKSVSDKYGSKLDGNGRGFVVDAYAKETYYPTTIRYSLKYEQNTNINNSNKFYSGNLDEYDRQKGDIQRLKVRGSQMRVFQSRACGAVPLSQNVLQTADGSSIISQSSNVFNKIQYYLGEYGIGNQYCSLASSPQADYFTDPVLGAQIRIGNDGITSLTELYKSHFFFTDKISKYQNNIVDTFGNGAYAKIISTYDIFEEEYVTCMQEASGRAPYTFGFSEKRNSYTSFYEYYPEWICTAGNIVITWKNGELWTHNNTDSYANFYGEQKLPSLRIIFNDFQNIKKHYNVVTTLGNTTWICPNQGDVNTNMGQQSKLTVADFKKKDDKYHAAFKRDMLSVGGLYGGNVLKGNWIELNLQPTVAQLSAGNPVDLYYVELGILQPLNNR